MERVTFAESLQRPNLDFVLTGLLAGTVGMIVGQGAIGKSYFALELGMSLVTGKPVAGGLWEAPKHGSCAICFGEDPAVIIRERKHWLMHYHGINNEGAAKIDDSLFTYIDSNSTGTRGLACLDGRFSTMRYRGLCLQ